ncbi:alpha/beta fold hydrolase [Hydrogenophaga sp. BPS33]|uniref:alpha/beta fold hydrolase n=1 Tax=Hydrogenophaga sp. BPS33 TaxID=2651974 RepID=UPI00132026A7|nr:alpha/beta fold hydrolase [Hydrogenophaga sp. BPS33]QHE87339.1 alpha/beta fold hydrolase [Hydrogenophaga sp. BPS33]
MSVETAAPVLRRVGLSRGGDVEVRDEGTGEPLLLMHGVGGGTDAWDIVFSALGQGRRLLAWNAPGYGGSTPFAVPDPTLDDYARAALDLLDALGLERANVLGHSMGGLIAARLASLWPRRVARLVLADCSSGHLGYDEQKRSQILSTRLTQDASDPWVYARARAPKLLSASASPELLEHASAMLARLRQPGFGQAARMVAGSDLFAFAGQIEAPTAVICGTEDGVTPEPLNQRIAQAIPGAKYRAIEGAGHWSFLEKPVQFAQAVEAHLNP